MGGEVRAKPEPEEQSLGSILKRLPTFVDKHQSNVKKT
jgi:hypothetical protein